MPNYFLVPKIIINNFQNHCKNIFRLEGVKDKRVVTSISGLGENWPYVLPESESKFTHWAYEASVVPGVAQSFQEHVSSFYRKFTSTAYSTKEGIIICTRGRDIT